jgi:hypothetical protein
MAEESMQTFIIGATFILGLVVMVVGLIALFKGIQKGSASAKFMGVEVSGSGGALVLLVGFILVLSGFGWASSQKQTTQANQDKIACVRDKEEVVADARQLHSQLQSEIQLRQELVRQIPDASRHQIEVQRPDLFQIKPAQVSPKLMKEFQRPTGMSH